MALVNNSSNKSVSDLFHHVFSEKDTKMVISEMIDTKYTKPKLDLKPVEKKGKEQKKTKKNK